MEYINGAGVCRLSLAESDRKAGADGLAPSGGFAESRCDPRDTVGPGAGSRTFFGSRS